MTKNTLDNNCEELYKYSTKITSCDDGLDKNHEIDKKYYIKSIDKATKDWIKTKPYFSKVKKITGNYQIKKCCKMVINYLALNLIQKAPDENTSKTINILHHFKTLTFYDQILQRLEKQSFDCNVEDKPCPDFICKNCVYEEKSGRHISIDILCYDEKYIQNNIIYLKSKYIMVN